MTRDAVLNDLRPNIDQLVEEVSKLDSESSTGVSASASSYTEVSTWDLESLKRSAHFVASSARSVLQASEGGSVRTS
jgi:hypothetical protein